LLLEYLTEIKIQARIRERLKKSIINNRLAHAFLFYGPEGCGKEAIAIELAKALNCQDAFSRPCNICTSCHKISQLNHPDIKFIFPISSSWSVDDIKERLKAKAENPYKRIDLSGHTVISIEQIRELRNESKYAPYEAIKRVYIITNIDRMTRESANSFLKLLEEPPDNLLLILITSSLQGIIDTIQSRCQRIYFPQLSYEDALLVLKKYRQLVNEESQIIHIAQKNLKSIFEELDQDINEKRRIVYNYLKAVVSDNILELTEIVDSIHSKRDKNFLMEILNLLILWFLDALHIVYSGRDTDIINIDFKDEVKKFSSGYGKSNFTKILHEIERAIYNLRSNVYSPLLLTVLGIRIKRNLIRSR